MRQVTLGHSNGSPGDTGKSNNTAKREVLAVPRRAKRTIPVQEYHLGFFTIWWSRMMREGKGEVEDGEGGPDQGEIQGDAEYQGEQARNGV